ncbi:DUF1918 domain-containing protein [Nocardiopsis sp. TNDT3]|uniref:DUF1918 domain-containing protein n=1 Tax=Nocardiopsis TaxID=2013 RepID=UPI000E3CC733|nr:DUF1918 domain-containing protein [Nocardiopsis sp. TNDT3]
MHASVGDRIHVRDRGTSTEDWAGEVIEVRGSDGGPPYVVRFPDGRETLVYPGPDAVVVPATAE